MRINLAQQLQNKFSLQIYGALNIFITVKFETELCCLICTTGVERRLPHASYFC